MRETHANLPACGRVAVNRRHRACALAGKARMRVIVKDMTRDEAIIEMIDANMQRETILPSERARAYKMKLEAIKRQGKRTDLTSVQLEQKLNGEFSRDIIGDKSGESGAQIRRFIRLTELIPPLLEMVDQKAIALNPAVELSYLSHEQQRDLVELMAQYDCTPSLSQAQRMKEAAKAGKLTRDGMDLVMQEQKPNQREILKLSRDRFSKYFRKDMPKKDIEDTITKALDYYQKYLERRQQSREQELSR